MPSPMCEVLSFGLHLCSPLLLSQLLTVGHFGSSAVAIGLSKRRSFWEFLFYFSCAVTMVAGASGSSSAIVAITLSDFLQSLEPKEKVWKKALEALDVNDITECAELQGADADVVRKFMPAAMSGGVHALLERAIAKWKLDHCKKPVQWASTALVHDSGISARVGAIENALAPTPKPVKHIDIGAKLCDVAFSGMDWTSWPKSAAVDALADFIEKKRDRTGVAQPFILQELEAFHPNWVPQSGESQ